MKKYILICSAIFTSAFSMQQREDFNDFQESRRNFLTTLKDRFQTINSKEFQSRIKRYYKRGDFFSKIRMKQIATSLVTREMCSKIQNSEIQENFIELEGLFKAIQNFSVYFFSQTLGSISELQLTKLDELQFGRTHYKFCLAILHQIKNTSVLTDFSINQSFFRGQNVSCNTKGAIRPHIYHQTEGTVWNFKFFNAKIKRSKVDKYIEHLPNHSETLVFKSDFTREMASELREGDLFDDEAK